MSEKPVILPFPCAVSSMIVGKIGALITWAEGKVELRKACIALLKMWASRRNFKWDWRELNRQTDFVV